MEQENKMTIEEASVNLGCVKKEVEEEFEFAENKYKVASTYQNIFGETLEDQRDNLYSLIGFLDDDIIMTFETGTIKLEDVKEENEEFHFETIQCDSCKVWLEKDEYMESHMLHCLKNYNRLSHNLPSSRPKNTSDEDKARGTNEISPSIDVDAGHSIPSTETSDSKRSSGIDCRAHRKDHFHGDQIGTTHANISEKEYKCSESSYETDFKGLLKRHLNTHRDVKSFECNICKKGFTEEGSLKKHIRNHHSNTIEKEYKCSECSYHTNYKSNLKQHLNTHNDIKAFECDICKQRFTRKSNLKLHIRNQHSNTRKDIKPFECDICKKGFSRKRGLKNHIRDCHSNTREKAYKCSECPHQTNDKCNFKRHLDTHNDIKPFECDICKQRFTRKSNLKLHIRNQHSNTRKDIKPFECDICKKEFSRKRGLKNHIRDCHSNTIEKAYKCSECPHQTNDKCNFKRHLDTHNDIKPFECDICKQRFTRKSNLKLHIRNQHSNTRKDIKPFECDICKKGFTRKGYLKIHIRNQHSNSSE